MSHHGAGTKTGLSARLLARSTSIPLRINKQSLGRVPYPEIPASGPVAPPHIAGVQELSGKAGLGDPSVLGVLYRFLRFFWERAASERPRALIKISKQDL